ncbi:hypothetical protein IQ235_05800 [Oscillatoriales cyanobacterium LEGE 11467]|uniref:Uncharacterized protein n=1 Tax=Zarconia navalis LEGE 11467 TaxID=1828826 RepID=A0A928VZ28_9CYAN|nr:hypothetical protein [Zarconia navalis]MBE9040305.1 hypothetical protein [Zarconia navalis LEGE 11467]
MRSRLAAEISAKSSQGYLSQYLNLRSGDLVMHCPCQSFLPIYLQCV